MSGDLFFRLNPLDNTKIHLDHYLCPKYCVNLISRIDFLQGKVEERGTNAAGQAGQDRDDAARRTQEGRQRHATHLAR